MISRFLEARNDYTRTKQSNLAMNHPTVESCCHISPHYPVLSHVFNKFRTSCTNSRSILSDLWPVGTFRHSFVSPLHGVFKSWPPNQTPDHRARALPKAPRDGAESKRCVGFFATDSHGHKFQFSICSPS